MPLNFNDGGELPSSGTRLTLPGKLVTGSLNCTRTKVFTGTPIEPACGVTPAIIGAVPTLILLLLLPAATTKKLLEALIVFRNGVTPVALMVYTPGGPGVNGWLSSKSSWLGSPGTVDESF